MRIIVIHPGALGDVVLSLPAMAALRKKYPSAEIVSFSGHDVARLFGLADRWTHLERSCVHRLFSAPDRSVTGVAEITISWMGSGDSNFIENLKASTGGEVICAPSKPRDGEIVHASTYLLQSIGCGEIDFSPLEPHPSREHDNRADAILKDNSVDDSSLLLIHPGAGAESKRWPAASFAEVASRWKRERGDVMLLQGPADEACVSEISKAQAFPIAANEELGTLASLFKRASAYVGNDSGVTHLAAASGAPTVAIFGPTDPRLWAPQGRSVSVVRDADVGDVWNALIRITGSR